MPSVVFGTDTATSISRHIILPYITDQVYRRSALFFRLNAGNKKNYSGGLHYEAPFIYDTWDNVQSYSGYDLLDTTPQDNIKNGAWDTKQYNAAISLSGRDLLRCNTEMAVANLITTQAKQARMGLANRLGTDLHQSSVTSVKNMTGLKDAVDDGTTATSYASLVRATNTYLNSTIDSTTGTLTIAALRTAVGNATKGGHAPTIILSRQEQYNRFHALGTSNQRFTMGPTGGDVQLLQAGFTNLLFDNIPWVIDDKVIDGDVNSSNSAIMILDEEFMELTIAGDTDFTLTDFQVPPNQNAMVQHLRWWGELICTSPQTNAKLIHVTA